jgi:hypothetical protein
MSATPPKRTYSHRFLTSAELAQYRDDFERLAVEFDDLRTALRGNAHDVTLPALVRVAMARAGRHLKVLLLHRAIPRPQNLPPWLSLRTPGLARPRFDSVAAPGGTWSKHPPTTVLGLVPTLRVLTQLSDRLTIRHPEEDRMATYVHRATFVEAVSGWLGHQCTPPIRVVPPTMKVTTVATQEHSDKGHLHLVTDWPANRDQQSLLMLDLARDSALVCRLLVTMLREHPAPSPSSMRPSCISKLNGLADMQINVRRPARARRLGKIDRALLQLLIQDIASGKPHGVLRMSTKQLADQLRGTKSRAPRSGSLRPDRTPYFQEFRDFYRRHPRGRPIELIRRLPDEELRAALAEYCNEAQGLAE